MRKDRIIPLFPLAGEASASTRVDLELYRLTKHEAQ